jgi:DNA mismatch repair protein MutS
VKNFNIAVVEEGGEVIFLYKIVPGGVDKSYGIHVAKLAGLPKSVVHRAQEVLEELEEDSSRTRGAAKGRRRKEPPPQLPLFGQKSPLLEELEELEIDSLSPLEALTKLYELQKKVREG